MRRVAEALFLVVIVAAAIYLIASQAPGENQQPSGGGQLGGEFSVEVLSLTVSPQQPMVGETIEVVAALKNTGSKSGTYQAQLRIDGEVKHTLSVDLQPGEIKNAQFRGAMGTPGAHVIEVGNRSVTITVVAPPGGATERWSATIRAPT